MIKISYERSVDIKQNKPVENYEAIDKKTTYSSFAGDVSTGKTELELIGVVLVNTTDEVGNVMLQPSVDLGRTPRNSFGLGYKVDPISIQKVEPQPQITPKKPPYKKSFHKSL